MISQLSDPPEIQAGYLLRRLKMKRIIEQTSEYTIIELSLDQNGLIVDAQYIVRYKCTPKEDICSTLEGAREAAKKRLGKEDK